MRIDHGQLFKSLLASFFREFIFADDTAWRKPVPDTFEMAFTGENHLSFRYRLLKLKNLDYRRFLRSRNPRGACLSQTIAATGRPAGMVGGIAPSTVTGPIATN